MGQLSNINEFQLILQKLQCARSVSLEFHHNYEARVFLNLDPNCNKNEMER